MGQNRQKAVNKTVELTRRNLNCHVVMLRTVLVLLPKRATAPSAAQTLGFRVRCC